MSGSSRDSANQRLSIGKLRSKSLTLKAYPQRLVITIAVANYFIKRDYKIKFMGIIRDTPISLKETLHTIATIFKTKPNVIYNIIKSLQWDKYLWIEEDPNTTYNIRKGDQLITKTKKYIITDEITTYHYCKDLVENTKQHSLLYHCLNHVRGYQEKMLEPQESKESRNNNNMRSFASK